MEQTPRGSLRPWRLFHGQVGVAGPEAEAARSECEAPARLWGALKFLVLVVPSFDSVGALD